MSSMPCHVASSTEREETSGVASGIEEGAESAVLAKGAEAVDLKRMAEAVARRVGAITLLFFHRAVWRSGFMRCVLHRKEGLALC